MVMKSLLFYIPVLSFLFGVFVRSLVQIEENVLWLFLLVAFGLVVLWRRNSNHNVRNTSPLLFLVLFLTFFAVGAFQFSDKEAQLLSSPLHNLTGQEIVIEGEVVTEPDRRESSTLLTIKTKSGGRFLLTTDRFAGVEYGDEVQVKGVLKTPEPFNTDLGRVFDYPGYLLARGVTHTMSFADVTIINDNQKVFLPFLYNFKNYFLSKLEEVISPPSVYLGEGLLLGVKAALGEDLLTAFRQSGIIHIVVLSGYNIMLVVAFVLYVSTFFLPYRARIIFSLLAVFIFTLLVGYSPSVARASIMAAIFLGLILWSRPYYILRALILAAVTMVFINPYVLVFDVGFQLSCLATLGLVLIAPVLEKWLEETCVFAYVRSLIVATLATQIAVLPLILFNIGEWSLVSLPVNLLVVPMVPIAMLLTFVSGLLAMVLPILAAPVALLAEISLSYIIWVAKYASQLPFAVLTFPPFSGVLVFVSYAVLGWLWYWFFYKNAQTSETHLTHLNSDNIVGIKTWVIEEESLVQSVPTTNPFMTNTKRDTQTVSPDVGVKPKQTPVFFR